MFGRHAFLGLALAAAGLVAGGATVLAGDAETESATLLHGPGARHGRHAVPVVIDRTDALRRVGRLLDDLRALERVAESRRSVIEVEINGRRVLRGDDTRDDRDDDKDDARELRSRGGETLGHRHDERHGDAVVDRHVRRMTRDLAALHEALRAAPIAHRAPVVVIEPVGEREFREFLRAIRRPHWDDDRLHVLRDVAKHHHFTSAQAAEIVRHGFRFEQLDAAVVLYPRLVDPDHVHRLYESLRWSSDRDELRRAIKRMER